MKCYIDISVQKNFGAKFVGTCLLALKNNLCYTAFNMTAAQIRTRIKEVLEELLILI